MLLPLGAFTAGLVSFLSPCIMPVLPGFLAFIVGARADESTQQGLNWYALYRTLHFAAGFSLVFVLMGLSASGMGRFLVNYQMQIGVIGGAMVVTFGLIKLELIYLPFAFQGGLALPRSGSSFLLGMAFSVAWTPCVGPVLASILIIAGTQGSVAQGILLLTFYSAGLTLPFLLAALFLERIMNGRKSLSRWSRHLNRAAGAVLVALGLLMMTGQFTRLSAWLS